MVTVEGYEDEARIQCQVDRDQNMYDGYIFFFTFDQRWHEEAKKKTTVIARISTARQA